MNKYNVTMDMSSKYKRLSFLMAFLIWLEIIC